MSSNDEKENVPLCPVIGFSFGHVVHGVTHTAAKKKTSTCKQPLASDPRLIRVSEVIKTERLLNMFPPGSRKR